MFKTDFTRKAFGEALVEYGTANDKVVVLTADVSSSVLTNLFAEKFPDRFYNVGIAEAGMVDAAAGLALGGMIPFANTFASLLLRATEQIRTVVAYGQTNVKLVGGYAGLSDFKDGPTHHSIIDVAVMRSMPGMAVVVPADSTEVRKMIPLVAEYPGPVYLRISRADMPVIFSGENKIEIGKGITVSEGRQATIIANGHMVARSVEAVGRLREEGVDVRLVNMHTVKPLDAALVVKCARETGAIVTAEEHSIIGGLGGAVAEVLAVNYPVPVEMVGIADTFTETALDHDSLLDSYGMSVEEVILAVRRAIERK